jgi:beta-1,4-mannooligosaccharide/beta-1,4-mannosyl-N-acetylglucosamine phosphorylase
MSKVKMISQPVPKVPWQDKPEGHTGAPVWRYTENPIIGRNPVEGVARIFNSAVMPYGDEFIGVFRGEQVNGIPYIYLGRSKDAIHWDFEKNKIPFVDEEGKPFMPIYAYDPRLVKVEDTYYISHSLFPSGTDQQARRLCDHFCRIFQIRCKSINDVT